MDINQDTLNYLANVLEQTFSQLTRKQAENELKQRESQPRFLMCLFKIIEIDGFSPQVKFAAAIYIKNLTRREWHISGEEDNIISQQDREYAKSRIVDLIMSSPPNFQIQLSETLNSILSSENIDYWKLVIDALSKKFDSENYSPNVTVLRVIDLFMQRFRNERECLEFGEHLQIIFDMITQPLYVLFVTSLSNIEKLPSNSTILKSIFDSILLMIKIYISACTHDIPQSFDDHKEEFFKGFHNLLNYNNPCLESDDPDESGVLEEIKTCICEICRIYYYKYTADFVHSEDFLKSIWTTLVNIGPEQKYDMLVSEAMNFITTVVKRTGGDVIFQNDEVLQTVCEKIIVPNCRLRDSDIEALEDEPIGYVRREIDGSSIDSRRHASMEMIRAFVYQYEERMARVFMDYSNKFIEKYNLDPPNNWRDKDTANFLFNAIAIKTFTTQLGATKVVPTIDFVKHYQSSVLPDLDPGSPSHKVLKVGAIKFICNFRYHLGAQDLLNILPILITHLASPHYIVYTFAAICIERILFLKLDGKLVFTEQVLKSHLETLLGNLFDIAERPSTPEKVAENEFIMRAVMRIIFIGKETITHHKALISKKLGNILAVISKNPSNPKFNHYLFECIGGVVKTTHPTVEEFEASFWPSFQYILAENIAEFFPYTIQIMSQILSFHDKNMPLPKFFQDFWPPVVQPPYWESKGNVPALVKLLKEYLRCAPSFVSDMNNIRSILGVFNRLLNSKPYEEHSFDILEAVFLNVDLSILDQFLQTVFLKILQRIKTNPSTSLILSVTKFVCFLLTIKKPDMNPDIVLSFFARVDPGAFAKLLREYVIPKLSQVRYTDRVLVVNGFTILLTECPTFLSIDQTYGLWINLLENIILLVSKPINEIDTTQDIEAYDINETEFQNAFVRLASSSTKKANPAIAYGPPEIFLVNSLKEANSRSGGVISQLLNRLSPQASVSLEKLYTASANGGN
ncbi:Cse1-domain-containing protein [Neoconidiobolus thromboides FSU 785]|nr:Cse1-domain-containing protein [Neoconidiobolus thromboides FSU 785]